MESRRFSSISTQEALLTLESLPPEVQIDILSFLTPSELIKVCETCKKLRLVGLSDKLWKNFVEEALSITPPSSSNSSNNEKFRERSEDSASYDALLVETPNGTAFFPGACSYYEIYLFVSKYCNLLGYWQGDLPHFGKTIRIIFLPKSSSNPGGPSFLCQEVGMTNKLIRAGWEEWKEITSFELGRSVVTGIGGGTQLERWNEMLKIDLCYPAMTFGDFWKADWEDFLGKLRDPHDEEYYNQTDQLDAKILWRKAYDNSNVSGFSSRTSLSLNLERVDPYQGVEEEIRRWKWPTEHGFLPYRFPTPAALPAFSSVECIPVNPDEKGTYPSTHPNSFIFTRRDALSGNTVKIDRLTMTPDPPPYDRSNRANEFHRAYQNRPLSFFPLKPVPRDGSRVLPIWNEQEKAFDHKQPPPALDPSHVDFDWDKLEGLYGMSYGPHGVELIYIRTRLLLEEEFPSSSSTQEEIEQPEWWPEPSLQDPDMYSSMAISYPSVKPGVRVLEGVKISGDPHVPRGSVSFRAFLDDPSCVSIPWRPPPPKVRNHLPFPHRTDEKTANASMLSQTSSNDTALAPGYLAPAHGRIAEAGFIERTWFPAQMHISNVDEIRLWWHNMGAVAVAHRLTTNS